MKLTVFLFAFGSLFNSLIGQEHPIDSFFPLNENKKVEYDSIYTLENTPKNEIYNSLQEFIDKYYNLSLEQGSRVNDRESGLISFVFIDTKVRCLKNIRYNVRLKIKDNKYRVIFSNIQMTTSENQCIKTALEEPVLRFNMFCAWHCTFKYQKDWKTLRETINKNISEHYSAIKNSVTNNIKDKSEW
jgi:hypothetical protein